MRIRLTQRLVWTAALLFLITATAQAAERLKPYVLASVVPGNFDGAVKATQVKLKDAGFRIVGEYEPFADHHILIVTDPQLLKIAAASKNGGFGAVQRI